MFFWKLGNACGGGERKGKVMKTLDFYYASGKEEGPAQGALTRRENMSGRFLSRGKACGMRGTFHFCFRRAG